MKTAKTTRGDLLLKSPARSAVILLLLTGLMTGCASNATTDTLSNLTRCPDQRPQICTREYNPVCAQLSDASTRTYATGCTACADENVVGWVAGECPSPD